MDFFKPLKRQFVPRRKSTATLALPADGEEAPQSAAADAVVTEMQGDDGWMQWQDSVQVQEYLDECLRTVPGRLE